MTQIDITQENFNKLVDILNHRVTKLEKTTAVQALDIKWIKRIGYYMASLGTIGLGLLARLLL